MDKNYDLIMEGEKEIFQMVFLKYTSSCLEMSFKIGIVKIFLQYSQKNTYIGLSF